VSKLNERVMMQVTIDQETYLLLGTVIEKTTDGAIVDFNHPRAGETIILSLEVMRLFKACNK
jgi:FKBP-type peptidyl-prolyl cis-trans isomerase 2